MRISLTLVLSGSLLLFSGRMHGQSPDDNGKKGTKITFHVTSVTHNDDDTVCQSGECSATKFTVEGYAIAVNTGSRIEYVLTCDEYFASKPTVHVAVACSKLHANNDYDARLLSDSIDFWPDERYTPPPMRAIYSIESEKEVSKSGK